MFSHQKHIWFIDCVFNTPCPTCAFFMHWSCITHSHLLHAPLLPLSCIGLYLASSSQHVMFTLCFVAFYFVLGLNFIFSFISQPFVASLSFFIPSSLTLFSPCYSCQKGGEYTLESIPECFCHFYMIIMHILRGRNSISHAHLQGERYSIGEMHIPRGRRH